MDSAVNTWLSQITSTTAASELADPLRAKAFGITPENINEVLIERSQLLRSIYPTFSQFCQTTLHSHPNQLLVTLWHLWLPLAIKLASYRQQQAAPLIQGILGGQGTGKSTLAAMLTLILSQLGYRTVSLSLDDLYKTYRDRLILQQQDPRLVWRGPPGTHDVELGLSVLNSLRHDKGGRTPPANVPCQPESTKPIAIPRFDKSAYGGLGDRTQPEIIQGADIVLFEGWFVGVRPIDPVAFDNPPPPILTAADRQFARDINTKLLDYLPLWERLDQLILLYPSDYRCSLDWRKQAEHQMIAAGKSGMTDSEIAEFVKYFWRSLHPELFIKPLLNYPSYADLVIKLNGDRSVGAVYRPVDKENCLL